MFYVWLLTRHRIERRPFSHTSWVHTSKHHHCRRVRLNVHHSSYNPCTGRCCQLCPASVWSAWIHCAQDWICEWNPSTDPMQFRCRTISMVHRTADRTFAASSHAEWCHCRFGSPFVATRNQTFCSPRGTNCVQLPVGSRWSRRRCANTCILFADSGMCATAYFYHWKLFPSCSRAELLANNWTKNTKKNNGTKIKQML